MIISPGLFVSYLMEKSCLFILVLPLFVHAVLCVFVYYSLLYWSLVCVAPYITCNLDLADHITAVLCYRDPVQCVACFFQPVVRVGQGGEGWAAVAQNNIKSIKASPP